MTAKFCFFFALPDTRQRTLGRCPNPQFILDCLYGSNYLKSSKSLAGHDMVTNELKTVQIPADCTLFCVEVMRLYTQVCYYWRVMKDKFQVNV